MPRPLSVVLLVVGSAVYSGALRPPSAAAQSAPPAPVSYVYLRGADTIGTEQLSVRGGALRNGLHGVLRMKEQPQIDWDHAQTGTTLGALQMRVTPVGAPRPAQEATFTVRRDSLIVDIVTGSTTSRQAVALPSADLVPLANASVLHAAFIAAYGRRRNLPEVPIVLTTGGQTANATLTQAGDTTVLQLGKVSMRIRFAPDGLPLAVEIPAQGARVVRR